MAKSSDLVVGIDLGGTKILAAAVDAQGKILGRAKRSTDSEDGPPAVLNRMADCAREAVARADRSLSDVRAVGIGAPGPLDSDKGIVIFAPNLSGWKNVPVRAALEKTLRKPVFLENDVNVGTLGEHVLGAGKGIRDLVGIFVGTGIGGGVILNGQLHRGLNGTAGEIGHMIIQIGGPRCGCGNRGCLEALASRTAIARDIAAAIRNGKKSKLGGKDLDPSDLKSSDIAKALEEGDRVAVKVIQRAAKAIGIGIVNIIHVLNPEMIVLGGGAMAFGDHILPVVRKTVEKRVLPLAGDHIQIVPAKLADDSGVLGAAVLARQRMK
ncbi:MAG: ROK family protein [Candidatus Latescibacteria bacterium]|nr:ROK family protein [Candidatus Latescibacterota bacterium]